MNNFTRKEIWDDTKENAGYYSDPDTPKEEVLMPCSICDKDVREFIELKNRRYDDSYYGCPTHYYICKDCFLKGE